MLEHLRQLQEFDLALDRLAQDIQGDEGERQRLQGLVQESTAKRDAASSKLEELRKAKCDLDTTLQDEEARLKKSRARLQEIKSNFEYHALRREIDGTERANFALEQQIKGLAEQITAAEAEIAQIQTALDEAQKALSTFESTAAQKQAELSGEIAATQTQREGIIATLDRAIVSRYTLVRKRHARAVVEAVSGTCQGCHMNLPPQLAMQLRTNPLSQCPHCHRFIFVHVQEGHS